MGVAKKLVASIDTHAARPGSAWFGDKVGSIAPAQYRAQGSLLISGLSYKTAVSNELLTSIFPL